MYSSGVFYLSLEVLNEKYLTLSYILTAHLCFFIFRSDHRYIYKFQKNLQFVIGCDGILKYPEISGQFLTRRPQMVTRWCTSPTDWIFIVKLQGDSSFPCSELFSILCARLPVCLFLWTLRFLASEYRADSLFIALVSFKIWFFSVWEILSFHFTTDAGLHFFQLY